MKIGGYSDYKFTPLKSHAYFDHKQVGVNENSKLKAPNRLPRFDTINFNVNDGMKFSDCSSIYKYEYDYVPPLSDEEKLLNPNVIDNTNQVLGEKINGTYHKKIEYVQTGTWANGSPKIERKYDDDYDGYYDRNSGKYSFFDMKDYFLIDAANEYAKIEEHQEFLYRPTQDSYFINSALDFFYGDDQTSGQYKQMQDEIDVMVKELAGKIKNGENTDLSELKSTITICGRKLTYAEIKKIQADSAKITDPLKGVSAGTDDFAMYAEKGLAKAVGMAYGDSLGGELGEAYKKAIERGADRNVQACLNLREELRNRADIHDYNLGNAYTEEYAKKAYDLFSKVDQEESFGSVMNKFDKLISSYSNTWMGGVNRVQMDNLKKMLSAFYNSNG